MSSTARLRAAFASSWAQSNCLAKVSTASTVDVLMGSTPRRGCWPTSSSNGVQHVAAMDLVVICKLHQWEPVSPVVLLMAHKDSEIGLYLLVHALRLAISLWVVGSGGS